MSARSRHAAEFAAALDDPSLPMSDEVREYVDLVGRLGDVNQPSMRPEFRDSLRARLVDAAPEHLVAPARTPRPQPVRRRGRELIPQRPRPVRRRSLASFGAAAAIVLGTATAVGAVSQQALPGDTLYPVKRLVERAQVGLERGDQHKGRELLDQASTRLDEIRALTVKGSDNPQTGSEVVDTLNEFRSQASTGGQDLLRAYVSDQNGQDITDLRTFTRDSITELNALARTLGPGADKAMWNVVVTLSTLDSTAIKACPSCSDLPPLQIPAELRATLALLLPRTTGPPVTTPTTSPRHGPTSRTGGLQSPVGSLPTVTVSVPGLTQGVTTGGLPGQTANPSSAAPTSSIPGASAGIPGVTLPTLQLPTLDVPSIGGVTGLLPTLPTLPIQLP